MIMYLITNTVTKKLYIGQTICTLKKRWSQHMSDTKRMRGPHHLVHSIRKHGYGAFTIETLHECETKEEMDFVEMFYIEFLGTKAPNGYNLTDGGDGTQGRSGWKASEETRVKLRLRKNNWLGRKHTPESRAKQSVAKKGRPWPASKDKYRRKHGTYSKYIKGCRCEPCREAGKDYRERRQHG